MNKVNLIIVDDFGNFYGILKVVSDWNNMAVKNLFTTTIKEKFGNEENFFKDFSGNLSIVFAELEKKILGDKEKVLKNEYYMNFQYGDYEYFNVDEVFEDERIDSIGYDKEDLKCIVDMYCDMLKENIKYGIDTIGESFYDWCEGGDCFENRKNIRTNLMRAVYQDFDKATYRLFQLFDRLKK